MTNLAILPLDHLHDPNGVIMRHLPEDVKAAQITPPADVPALEDDQFALVIDYGDKGHLRLLPMACEGDCKVAAAYLEAAKEFFPGFARARAAEALETKIAARVPISDVGYLPVTVDDSSPSWGLTVNGKQYFPLHEPMHVEHALNMFTKTAQNMQARYSFAYARNLEQRANDLKIAVAHDHPIHKYTGNEMNPANVKKAINQRLDFLRVNERAVSADAYARLIMDFGCNDLSDMPAGDEEHQRYWMKQAAAKRENLAPELVVATLEQLDKLAEIQYGADRIMDPYEAVFTKTAADIDTGDGNDVPANMGDQLSPELVAQLKAQGDGALDELPPALASLVQKLWIDGSDGAGDGGGDGRIAESSGFPPAMQTLSPRYTNQTIKGY